MNPQTTLTARGERASRRSQSKAQTVNAGPPPLEVALQRVDVLQTLLSAQESRCKTVTDNWMLARTHARQAKEEVARRMQENTQQRSTIAELRSERESLLEVKRRWEQHLLQLSEVPQDPRVAYKNMQARHPMQFDPVVPHYTPTTPAYCPIPFGGPIRPYVPSAPAYTGPY